MYNIGGMAHFNGISFASRSARSRVAEGGRGVFARSVSAKRRAFMETVTKVPIIRGFFSLGVLGSFVWGIYLVEIAASFLSETSIAGKVAAYALSGLDIVSCVFLAALGIFLIFRRKAVKRIWQYHGAEHMVINAYHAGWEITVENIAKADRSSARCGSMFVVLFFIVQIPLLFVPYSDYFLPLTFALCYELFNALPNLKWLGWLLRLGFYIQEHWITAQPDERQLVLARDGFLAVLDMARKEDQDGGTVSGSVSV